MESATLTFLSQELATNSTTNATMIPSVPAWATNVVLCYLAIILILGVPGNTLLLLAQCRNRNKSTTDYLVATMATFELICSSAVTTMNIFRYNPLLWRDIASDFTCKLNMFMSFYNAMSSNILLVAIATDRYIMTCLPHNNFYSIRASKYICVAIAVLSIIFGIPGLMCYVVDETLDCISMDIYEKFIYGIRFVLTTFTFLGFVMLCFTYVKISLTLRRRQRLRRTVVTTGTSSGTSTRSAGNMFSSLRKKNRVQPESKTNPSVSPGIVEKGSSTYVLPSDDLSPMDYVQSIENRSNCTIVPISFESPSRQSQKASTGPEHTSDLAYTSTSRTSSVVTQKPSVRLVQGSERDRQIINKTTKITFLITLIYAASYILAWMFILIGQSGYSEGVQVFAGTIHLVNCVSNPILFFSMSSKFRKMLKDIFYRQ